MTAYARRTTYLARSTNVKLSSTGPAPTPALQRAVQAYREQHGYTDPDRAQPLPDWLITHLGPVPHWRHSERWFALAEQVALWREQHLITDTTTPLGEQPTNPDAADHWQALHTQIDKLRAHLLVADEPKSWGHWAQQWAMSLLCLLGLDFGFTRTELGRPLSSDRVHTLNDWVFGHLAATALTWVPAVAVVLLVWGVTAVYIRLTTQQPIFDPLIRAVAVTAQYTVVAALVTAACITVNGVL
ncbi:hypothetical protein [Nocardia salmonicida]|uniref:hypothetical protein n=1 Tax=Nocardia salmonicida TaxID=53431 RepID=UPI0007A40C26|nr:hypothetical protein [Nocardia salmonicida]